ncbi:MAG: hypothetical protein H6662_05515 [Ardenticatenaceae bacterium]|nr:hypothetical protein [Ardenticatenaceae bacterium]
MKAIESFHPELGTAEPKFTKDHQYPRKVAARRLLDFDWVESIDPVEKKQ